MTREIASTDAETAILDLLQARGEGKTICPSEAARALARARNLPDYWREDMDNAHAAARKLAGQGAVRLLQGGEEVEDPVGAYRIALPPAEQ